MVGHVTRVFTLLIVFVVAFAGVRALVLSPDILGNQYSQEINTEYWANYPLTYANGDEYGDTCATCHDEAYTDWASSLHCETNEKGMPGVSCEACHGPALAHLNAKGKEEKQSTAPIVEGTSEFCALCHKEIGPRTGITTQDEKHLKRDPCTNCHNAHSSEVE